MKAVGILIRDAKVHSKNTREQAALVAITRFAKLMEKEYRVKVDYGQGGNISDWKDEDFSNNGMLLVIKIEGKRKFTKSDLTNVTDGISKESS